MNLLSILAFLTGLAGVLLTIRKNIWCWPMALISVVASAIAFFDAHLYGDMSLQVFYFVVGIYGWMYWKSREKEVFAIERTQSKQWMFLILATVFQSILYYFLLEKLKGDQTLFDAILTAFSLTATYMMTKRWIENWLLWVFIDTAYVVLYGIKEMWLFALLYLVFAGMAYYGWKEWNRELQKK